MQAIIETAEHAYMFSRRQFMHADKFHYVFFPSTTESNYL